MDHPASQKEALVTIYSVCQQNSAACEYFREIGGLMFVWNLAKSQVHSLVQEAALFTIGGLAENNGNYPKKINKKVIFIDPNDFFHFMPSIFLNRVIPSESQMNLFDRKVDQYHLWSSVCSNLCVCVNNPQNGIAKRRFKGYKRHGLMRCASQTRVIQKKQSDNCLFFGLFFFQARTQNFFISIGGLAVLDELLLKLIHGSLGNNTNIKLAVVVTKTLDACIANNTAVGVHLPKYNIVPNLLKLLSYNILDSGERFSIILTLGHCTEVCEENQYTLVKNNGLPLMIQALTEIQDDELNKAATFVLQNCKQMTEKLLVKMNQHSFQEDERKILEVDWQNEERILEDYWNEAKQILYRIRGLENEQESNRSEFIFKKPDFVVKSPMQKIQHSELQYPRNPSRGVDHKQWTTVPPKIRELGCSGCRTGRLSLNSRNFSKTLQSCQYLCERHKIILKSEMEYKRKLRRTIIANKNTSAYNNGNHDERRFRCKRSSTTVKESANFQCNAHSKNQTMKQIYSLQDQDLSENHPFEENTETLSNRSTTTLKKRRIRKDFTSEEISYLLEGVRKMGHHWNSILWAYPFQKGRTNVDIAKKYCKLQKNGKSRNTQPR
ncbi:hypothetical protein E2320_001131 [Naja naja]|nr:hypothetical protein E2320_001131 [Naja naja]